MSDFTETGSGSTGGKRIIDEAVAVESEPIDSDGDGLANVAEAWIGTDPHDFDTDGDGASDGFEHGFGSDPLDATDRPPLGDDNVQIDDGPTTSVGGDSFNTGVNTGGFGEGDVGGSGRPVNTGGPSPSAPQGPVDTDGDGLLDEYERKVGTDPHAADSDRDGLDDATELDLGTDPLASDTDGDGVGDFYEMELKTDPNNAEDVPDDDALAELFD